MYKKIIKFLFFTMCMLLTSCSSSNEIIFLDYAASAHINEKALEKFNTVSLMDGNSSGINDHAKILSEIEKKSAAIIAQKINAESGTQIVFTNNATTANNIAVLGVARRNKKCHLITSKIEHKSVLNVFKYLEGTGYAVTYLDVDRYGNVNLGQLEKSIRKNTKLISIQMFNSEIGTMQNMKAIGEIAKKHRVLFHSDASQSFCKYNIDVNDMNIDLLTISGYKIGAPSGIAALYVRKREQLQPILFGSGDELSPGTKPTALIASFASAIENFHFDKAKINKNFHVLINELLKIDDIYINSATPSHVVSVSIGGVLLKDILEKIKNYSFSSGCSCLGQGQSNVISAIDPGGKLPSCTLRISFSDKVNPDDLIAFAANLKDVVLHLRGKKSVGIGCSSKDKKKIDELNEALKKIL
ncbi:MAG: aminotransferase class V-fold PLP-dependent enzyme [Holosporaceae bacterium]|nr:aminotransferase class V-fold PLP-dependent enzyme [Holosporaceae bacterium]